MYRNVSQKEIDEAFRIATQVPKTSASQRRVALTAPIKSFRKGAVSSEAVMCRGMVFVSGQTASPTKGSSVPKGDVASLTEEGSNVPKGDVAEQQATKALEKVRELLEGAGSSPSRVVSAMIHVRSLKQDLAGFDKAWSRWINKETPPVRTVVQVDAISNSGEDNSTDLRVSVSVTAFL